MLAGRTQTRLLEAGIDSPHSFKTAVSLHCHTQHSKESLGFLSSCVSRMPVLSSWLTGVIEAHQAETGRSIDIERSHWRPPLTARQVFESEVSQIETLGLEPLVSITDHDDIEASACLRVLDSSHTVPISLEWTVPFGIGFFHLGVHNLAPEQVTPLVAELKRLTEHERGDLAELLAWINAFPETLVVLNHPLWDIESIGRARHMASLLAFLVEYGEWIHALEVNGYRRWPENQATMQMAEMLGYPVVAGGDRHAMSPNAALNLTTASTFGDYAGEIRREKLSTLLIMPSYREHMYLRVLESVADTLRYYPQFPESKQHWGGRVYVSEGVFEGVFEGQRIEKPLSSYWDRRAPGWLGSTIWLVCLLGSPRFRSALRLALPMVEGTAL
jgi:hypothetical protein